MLLKLILPVCLFLFLVTSCSHKTAQGWENNNPHNGGFQRVPLFEQETPPDMVLIEGGTWPVKTSFSDSLSCADFYISKYEETNGQYLAYLNYLRNYYSESTYQQALPDTTLWKQENLPDAETNYLIENYFRNPLYKDYPMVGLSSDQIKKYAAWKTDRMNEFILIREEIFDYTEPVDSDNVFSTVKYLAQTYETPEQKLIDLEPKNSCWGPSERIVRMEDGILLPRYRLPSLTEWTVASLSIGNNDYNYLKTLKETPFKKYDRDNHFAFLKLKPAKAKPAKQVSENTQTIHKIGAVYSGQPNNYAIHGLADGVREIIRCDSVTLRIVGGSWKTVENYAAVYQKTPLDGNHYTYPKSLESPDMITTRPCGVYGFRLAMDCLSKQHSGRHSKGN